MYYQDNFSKSFHQETAFMGLLDEIEERADWKVCPTDTLHVLQPKSARIRPG